MLRHQLRNANVHGTPSIRKFGRKWFSLAMNIFNALRTAICSEIHVDRDFERNRARSTISRESEKNSCQKLLRVRRFGTENVVERWSPIDFAKTHGTVRTRSDTTNAALISHIIVLLRCSLAPKTRRRAFVSSSDCLDEQLLRCAKLFGAKISLTQHRKLMCSVCR